MVCSETCDNVECSIKCKEIQKLIDRLAAYEVTGREPEEVTDMWQTLDMYGGWEGIQSMLEELELRRKNEELAGKSLSLEDLLKMEGKPVWCVDWDGNVFWGLVEVKDGVPSVHGLNGLFCWGGFYGLLAHQNGQSHKSWLAYRDEPNQEDV